jgi:alkylhydroperoxidase/carboxymuconolactone decarboxylase family protein YurZ
MVREETKMADQDVPTPVLDLLTNMTAASIEATTLDPEALMLVRIAALVAIDGPPASYLLNIGAAGEAGVGSDEVQGVLAAIAPIVGTAKVVSAAGNMARALGLALDVAEMEAAEA